MTFIVVAAILAQEGSHYIGGRTIGHFFIRQAEFAKLSHLALKVEIGTLQMRRIEKNYLLQHHDHDTEKHPGPNTGKQHSTHLKKYQTAADNVDVALDKMAKITEDKTVIMRINRLKVGISTHRKKFSQVHKQHVALGADENSGLHGVFRKAVHAVENKLKATNLDALTVKILMMRRHEKDYIARGKEIYVNQLDRQRAEFNVLIRSMAFSDNYKAEILALMDAYQLSFHAYVITAKELIADTRDLGRIYAEMVPDFQKLLQIAAKGEQQAQAQAFVVRDQIATLFTVIAALLLLASVSIAQIIGMSISVPVARQTEAMKRLAEGDTSIDIPDVKAKNEIGDMARAVRVFRDNAIDRLRLQTESENQREARARRLMKTERLITGFRDKVQAMLQSAVSNAGMMQGSAMSLAALATQTTSQTISEAEASTQASQNMEVVTTEAARLLASTNEISGQIAQNRDVATKAKKAAIRTDKKISRLTASAEKIGDVLAVIQGIAEQTNLLALNATSEAARAGENGKGFSVVAANVKALAGQTAKVTEMISKQIATIQSETELSAGSLQDITEMIQEFSASTETISTAFEAQGLSANQISSNIEQIAAREASLGPDSSQDSKTTKESHKSALRMLNFSHDVAAGNEELRVVVDEFLQEVAEA